VPVLYVVATPIGNLQDITLRALEVLRSASLIACEDTRTTRNLLARYGLRGRLVIYHEHNHRQRLPLLLRALEEGDVALVSEAGTPGISDPGADLVRSARERGFRVVPVPGPSAVASALSVAGLRADRFTFLGFLPRRARERRALLEGVAGLPWPLVVMEAPHRLHACLVDLEAVLGDREVAVCRELTKVHEEVFWGTLSSARQHFAEPRGEFTLVVAPASPASDGAGADPDRARRLLADLRAQGVPPTEAVARVARETGLPRREVYRLWTALSREGG